MQFNKIQNKLNIFFSVLISFLFYQYAYGCAANSDINNLIKNRVDKKYNVGIVVAIINNKEVKFYHAGYVSKENNAEELNEHTIFPIASVTKIFTTLLLAQELKQEKVKLNGPVQQYFSDIHIPSYQDQKITLKHLATHTSGLPAEFSLFNNSDPYASYTQQKLKDFLNSYQLTRAPGAQFEYADINIGILGEIISRIENQDYKNLIKNKITKSLDMNQTEVITSPEDIMLSVKGYNAEDKISNPYHFPILSSAGAIYSTASDLAKLVSANLGIKKTNLYQDMKLTHVPVYAQGKPMIDFDYPGTEKLYIALGWNVDKKYHLVWKNGNMPGFSSFIGFNSKTRCGVVVLANTGNIIFTDNLAMHLLNQNIPLFTLYQELSVNTSILHQYTGKFKVSDGTYYTFSVVGHHLKVQHISGNKVSNFFNIYPKSKNQFFGRIANAVFSFYTDKKGKMNFILKEGNKSLQAKKI